MISLRNVFCFIVLTSISQLSFAGYVISSALWNTKTIPVCWEDFSDSLSAHRNIAKSAVENSWAQHSSLTFTGWGECTSNSQGIRIQANVPGVPSNSDSSAITGMVEMVLNLGTGCSTDNCRKIVTIHEFGHALGLQHEQNRDDSTSCKPPAGRDGDIKIGPYDIDSVMDYCNLYSKTGLSEGDKAAINTLYPIEGSTEEHLVNRYFINFHKRIADPGGLAYWTGVLENAGCSANSMGQVIKSFVNSNEYYTRIENIIYGDQEFEVVKNMYRGALRRKQDTAGFNFYASKLKFEGMTYLELAEIFVTSPEFFSKAPGWCADF